MRFDRQNVIAGCLCVCVLFALAVWCGIAVSADADEVRIERERTEQQRIAACGEIEDERVAALCVAAVAP